MIRNRILFTSYKAYDGGHVIFGSNLKGNVVSGGNIIHDSVTITNVEHVSGTAFNLTSIGDNSKQEICLASVVDNSTLWHWRLGHANMRLQDEALNLSKFKKSIVILDDMLSRQKLSQDKEGLGFSKNEKTTSAHIRRIFLDGYGVLDVRTIFFIFLCLSSRMCAF
ncbi:hypothetical protein Tco_1029887 [Tanacetum coccineum]|uniref:GAG-pre-integrase domain-containing protein n=1 Tax=Tanacetum coccineum TaxID=301880 RepID=A0ABQ5G587_9ASTR